MQILFDIKEAFIFIFTEYFYQRRKEHYVMTKWKARPHHKGNKYRVVPKIRKVENLKPYKKAVKSVPSVPLSKIEPIRPFVPSLEGYLSYHEERKKVKDWLEKLNKEFDGYRIYTVENPLYDKIEVCYFAEKEEKTYEVLSNSADWNILNKICSKELALTYMLEIARKKFNENRRTIWKLRPKASYQQLR